MNPDSKLLLDEMHRLFAEQNTKIDAIDAHIAEADRKLDLRFADSDRWLEKRFSDVDDSITRRFIEIDDSISKCFIESDLNLERRITDSELRQTALLTEAEQRQDDRVSSIAQAAGSLENRRQESEGAVDDLKLKVDKLSIGIDQSSTTLRCRLG